MSDTDGVHGLMSPTHVGSAATRSGWPQVAIVLLAAALLSATVTAARADECVTFGDASLRSAVASQLVNQGQVPSGSDGTTITPSDMQTLTALSARNTRIVRLDGLELAANVASLDLGDNEIATITPLVGLTQLTQFDVSGNNLDLTTGSPAMSVIATLEGLGARVTYKPQRARLSQPVVSSSASAYGKLVTFSTSIVPRGAAIEGVSKVRLYHLETRSVTTRIKGKKKVAVNYWRLRRTLALRASSTGGLSVRGKLPSAGKWQARVAFGGSGDYESCASTPTAFVVRDPRIQAAISWAMRRRGSHAWDHYCLRFVCDCYQRGAGASVHRYDTARVAADALHAAKHPDTAAPRGALVFYHSMHGKTDLGHVGISLGDGTMINDYGTAGVKVMSIKSGLHYIGWAAPPLSPSICDWKQPPKP